MRMIGDGDLLKLQEAQKLLDGYVRRREEYSGAAHASDLIGEVLLNSDRLGREFDTPPARIIPIDDDNYHKMYPERTR